MDYTLAQNKPKPSHERSTPQEALARARARLDAEALAKKEKQQEQERLIQEEQARKDEENRQLHLHLMESTPLSVVKEIAIQQYQNSQLRQALLQSNETCKMLLEQSNHLQEVTNQKHLEEIQALKATVEKLQTSEQTLNSQLSASLSKLTDELNKTVTTWLGERMTNTIKRNEANIKKMSDGHIQQVKTITAKHEKNLRQLLHPQGFKYVVFWVATASWFVWLIQWVVSLIISLF